MSLTVPDVLAAELPAAPPQRQRQLTIASAYASLAWLMFLATLLGIYLEARRGDELFYEGFNIPLTQPNVMLAILAVLALMVQWSVWAVARNARTQAYLALGITALLGAAFVVETWFLYDVVGLGIGRDAPAAFFYAITASHLMMVVVAIVATLLVLLRVLAGSFGIRRTDGVVALALFWYATMASYVVIWLAVYIHK